MLSGFFRRENRFFLTGGAALAGFYLGHRRTQDLDLFTTENYIEEGVSALQATAHEQAGYPIERYLEAASQKDGGLTAGQLAWVLSEITIGEDAQPPGGISAAELRDYLQALRARLARMALPAPE